MLSIFFCFYLLQLTNSSEVDRRILSKLGDYYLIKHIIEDKNSTGLIGINTSSSPAPIRPPPQQSQLQQQLPLPGASSSSASNRNTYHQPVSN